MPEARKVPRSRKIVPPGKSDRITVNILPRVVEDRDWLVGYTGKDQTTVINDALHWYRVLMEVQENGGGGYLRERKGGELV